MKKLFLSFLFIACVSLLHADDILKNSDFTDGALNWHGDGKSPADLKPTDSLDTSAPNYGDKGLIIVLKPHDWTKIVQEFKTTSSTVILTVTYQLAPNTTFSANEEDYANVPKSIDFNNWKPFKGKVGGWMVMLSDFAKERLFYGSVIPPANATESQTFSGSYNSLIPEDEKTLCLAFPPGTGAVILTHVSLEK